MGKAPRPKRPAHRGRFWRNLFLVVFLVLVAGPVAVVIAYRFLPPPITFLMVERLFEGKGLDHRWRSLAQMSPAPWASRQTTAFRLWGRRSRWLRFFRRRALWTILGFSHTCTRCSCSPEKAM